MYGRGAGPGVALVVITAEDRNEEQGDVTVKLGAASLVEWLGRVMAGGG